MRSSDAELYISEVGKSVNELNLIERKSKKETKCVNLVNAVLP